MFCPKFGRKACQILNKILAKLFQPCRQCRMFSLIFADQVAVNLTNPRITIGRIQPEARHESQRNVTISGKLVPEARLELARP